VLDLLNSIDFGIVRWLNGFMGANDDFDYGVRLLIELNLIKGGVLAGLLWGTWSTDRHIF